MHVETVCETCTVCSSAQNSSLAQAQKIDYVLNILYISQVHLCLFVCYCFWSCLCACVCVTLHVSFSVLLCIRCCTAGERWLRDMDLAHWVCELWLNPWVYCFRHALTTSPQWPGSRLHSSRGGPLLTHSHPLLPLPPLSLPFSPHPLSVPPAPSFTSLLYPPSPLNFSQSLPSCCVFSPPLLLSLLSLFLSHCCQQDRNCLLASWRDRSCRPANRDKMFLNIRHFNVLIKSVEWVPFGHN